MEQLTKNQAVATSQEAVQNQNEPQLRDENAHNDKSVHGVLNPTYQAGLRRDAVQPSLVSWIKHSVDRFVIVSIFIPKLRLILILNSFLGSSDSLVFSELFHSLAPRPLAARSISDFLLTYLADRKSVV